MSIPGIGDPYWYEWYVGLQQVINMINPDSKIAYVTFQSEIHNTIDDVVVGYQDKQEVCFQVKHEVGDVGKGNLTFSKLIEPTTRESGSIKVSLIKALALGWEKARQSEGKEIIPVLYTNRNLGVNGTKRNFRGKDYTALSLTKFIEIIQDVLKLNSSIQDVENAIQDKELKIQWTEFKNAIGDDDSEIIEFLKAFQIKYSEGSLEELESNMIESLEKTFNCSQAVAKSLFDKLCSNLRIWTTTRRQSKVKVSVEDVFDALSLNNDIEQGEHELPYPTPFFQSRKEFSDRLIELITQTDKKIVFISGEPGSGKTSLISYLQLNDNLFKARYHTFKPISPEQKFYNPDTGLCQPQSLWNDLLIQMRSYFKGQLNEYNIPVTNALCTVEQMRNEVLRLSKILYERTGEKTVICIDGIDHAARANNEVTFLPTLFNPNEIPEGVIFTLVGQPAGLYDKYPLWIRNQTEDVEHFQIPKLLKDDIKSLLKNNDIKNSINEDVLAEFIFEKTEGNNLSVVFAIEEARSCESIENFEKILDIKHVSGDITNYYNHIWGHVSNYLSSKNLGFVFPDTVVASAITLLNGRVNSEILSKALDIKLFKEDWEELFELLYPLVQKVDKENEYALFHNDFRVFLMATINKNSSKYKSIAFQLAEYYRAHNNNIESSLNLIPLLISADRYDLIAEVFNVEYVIHSLAYGLSRNKLDEYASLAYESVLKSKSWKGYHNLYLAFNTLSQHYRYYEYFNKKYKLHDKSYVRKIHPCELRPSPLNIDFLESYKEMLDFCHDLLSYKDSISIYRAKSTFHLWMKDLTPSIFLNKLKVNELMSLGLWDENLIEELIKKWALLAAAFDLGHALIDSSVHLEEEIRASLQFNNTYFEYLLENNKIDESINVIQQGGVSYSCIEDNLQKILFSNNTSKYKNVLEKIIEKRPNLNDQLLARVCLIESRQNVRLNSIEELETISYITDQTSLKIILFSIIKGFQDYNKDVSVMIKQINGVLSLDERKGHDYEYLKVLIRHAFIVGRSIKKLDAGLDIIDKKLLLNSYRDFLIYDTEKVRTFNFKEAFNILLFLSLNQKWVSIFIEKAFIKEFVIQHLFNRNLLGMYYKTIILDYLIDNRNNDTIKAYLLKLYGQNGANIFQGNDFEETHNCFEEYGQLVLPELMNEINKKLQWDVVGYIDHKEYALWPILKYFQNIVMQDKKEWKTRGIELYKLSSIADIKGSNRASFEIKKEIASAAVNCGFSDAWLLRQQNEDFRFSLEILYNQIFDLIDNTYKVDEIISTWFLSCGILSWYNKEDRIGLKNVYYKCVEKGLELGNENIENIIFDLTPEHVRMTTQKDKIEFEQKKSEYAFKREEGEKLLRESLINLSNDQLIEFLIYEPEQLSRWSSVNIVWDIFEERNEITEQVAMKFVEVVLNRMENYSWGNSGCSYIVEKIIKVLKTDFLWELAEYNLINIDNSDRYYTCKENMDFLLHLVALESNGDLVKSMFDMELNCQHLWITGCGNLTDDFIGNSHSISNLPSPENIQHFIMNVLLEQIETRNIHRIEISLQGIHLLIKRYPDVFLYISDSWEYCSEDQKKYLIKLSERWSQENIEGFHYLKSVIEKEYTITNQLDKKFQLYLILKNHNSIIGNTEGFGIQYSAQAVDYKLPDKYPPIFDKSKISNLANQFLSVMEVYTEVSNNDIRHFLKKEKSIDTENIKSNGISRPGDSMLYPSSYLDLDMKVLYGEDQKGRWGYVPISVKAQFLLRSDDSWLISEIPKISFSEDWYIEKELKEFFDQGLLSKCKPYFKKITSKDVPENMDVIGACIWYPIGSKDGVIYTETTKFINNVKLVKDLSITHAMNPGSVLSMMVDQFFIIEEEDINETGICLINILVGTSEFVYGNSMTSPSLFLKEILGIKPSKDNPLIWVNEENEVVMYFERFACPYREAVHENYFRQPMMSRWVCNRDIIKKVARNNNLTYYLTDKIEYMPILK